MITGMITIMIMGTAAIMDTITTMMTMITGTGITSITIIITTTTMVILTNMIDASPGLARWPARKLGVPPPPLAGEGWGGGMCAQIFVYDAAAPAFAPETCGAMQ